MKRGQKGRAFFNRRGAEIPHRIHRVVHKHLLFLAGTAVRNISGQNHAALDHKIIPFGNMDPLRFMRRKSEIAADKDIP